MSKPWRTVWIMLVAVMAVYICITYVTMNMYF